MIPSVLTELYRPPVLTEEDANGTATLNRDNHKEFAAQYMAAARRRAETFAAPSTGYNIR
jgi:hypothetical protein